MPFIVKPGDISKQVTKAVQNTTAGAPAGLTPPPGVANWSPVPTNRAGYSYFETGTAPTDEFGTEEIVVTANKGATDRRVRLRAQRGQKDTVYGANNPSDNILAILHETDGIIFPYTPSISFEQSVDYKTVDLVHSNWDLNAFSRSPSATISVTGKFTVQNQREGEYVIAVMHFLRVASKMHFGENDVLAGLPPPILEFDGYGNYMFRSLKCVLKTHSYSLEDTVDYVDVKTRDGATTRVPSLLTISINIGIQQTPAAMRRAFNLEKFRTGALMRGGNKGWI